MHLTDWILLAIVGVCVFIDWMLVSCRGVPCPLSDGSEPYHRNEVSQISISFSS